MVLPFLWTKNGLFALKLKTLSWALFWEALIVAPPFLDMCLDIFGAWINQKKSFDWGYYLKKVIALNMYVGTNVLVYERWLVLKVWYTDLISKNTQKPR